MADRAPLVGMLNALQDQGQGVPLAGMPDPQVNVPFGELSVPHYSPSQRLGNAAQDVLEWFGAKPQTARHLVEGVGGVLGLTPAAVPMAAADLLDAKSRGDIGGTAQAALGMIPGAGPVERKVAEATEPVIKSIRAYHGSPHDFDKFDLSKIGTGEGAQVYGHGLYFAENPSVAGTYRNLAPPHQNVPPEVKQALRDLDNLGFESRAQALEEINANPEWMKRWDVDPTRSETEAKAAATIDQFLKNNPRGRGYEVNLKAAPEQFLDWDRSLSEQPQVLKALQTVVPNQGTLSRIWDDLTTGGIKDIRRSIATEPGSTGGSAYGAFSRLLGDNQIAATDALRSAGVPGIKYLDQGSRFLPKQTTHLEGQISGLRDMLAKTPEGDPQRAAIEKALAGRQQELQDVQNNATRNYVVFDPNIIDIIRKYSLAGAIPTGAISAGMLAQPTNNQPAL